MSRIDGRPQQRVLERERLAVGQHADRDQRAERCNRGVTVDRGELARVAQLAVVSENRHGARELRGRRLEPPETPEHRGAQAVARKGVDVRDVLHIERETLAACGLEQLAQQQRIAAGGSVARSREREVGLRAGAAGDHLACRADAERLGSQDAHALRRGQLHDLVGLVGLAGAARSEQSHRESVDPAGQVHQPAQRRRVAPVQVVRDEQDRLLLGDRGEQPVQPVGDGCGIRGALPLLAEHGRGGARGAREPACPIRRGGAPQQRLEQLADEAEAQLALDLSAVGAQHRDIGRGRQDGARVEERGLADAGRPLEEQRSSVTVPGPLDERRGLGELPIAVNQALRRQHRHRVPNAGIHPGI